MTGTGTEQRWTWDIPYIQPAAEGKYWVSGPLRSESVGPAATPEQAVMMVVECLPPGCGPAFVGTPEELAIHDAAALPASPESQGADHFGS
jgi:hypothetical protein